jgi:hypothetical protein
VDYRLYIIGEGGHIERRLDIEAADDAGATEQARQYLDGKDLELWQRDRLVSKLLRKPE